LPLADCPDALDAGWSTSSCRLPPVTSPEAGVTLMVTSRDGVVGRAGWSVSPVRERWSHTQRTTLSLSLILDKKPSCR